MNSYALAGEVLTWIADPYGDCDEKVLWRVLNAIRQRFYLMYEKLPLFDISMCFEAQTFCVDCNPCRDTFRGVTLPREFQNVEAMWYGNAPVQLFSSWREWQQGMAPECPCGLQKFDLPHSYASELDPWPNRPERMRVLPVLTEDFGGEVVLRYIDAGGQNRMETLKLEHNGAVTEFAARALAPAAGFSKKRTKGPITLALESGRVLSRYAPDETLPAYRRIKIAGLPADCAHVNIRGSRKYWPVYSELDVVETDNRVAFEEMARFVRLNEKQTKTGDDVRAMGIHAAQAEAALRAEKARDLGKSTQSELTIRVAGGAMPRIGPYRW